MGDHGVKTNKNRTNKSAAEIGVEIGFQTNPMILAIFRMQRQLIASIDTELLILEELKGALEKRRQILRDLPVVLLQANS